MSEVFERMAEHGHEQVVFCYDRETGMRAIIAIHSSALGPARGGTRYAEYDNEDDALEDALRLARGMAYKFAWTDMPRGGAKAVLIAGDEKDKQRQLRIYGRHIELLAGRFGTGPDYGTNSVDMGEVARETDFVWGASAARGGTGDSGPLTAQGVASGVVAAVEHRFGSADLHGRSVAVQGLGSVGGELARLLNAAGATVIGADPDPERAAALAAEIGCATVDPQAIYEQEVDVFSPNALGGSLNAATVPQLRCAIVAGGANNQLGTATDGRALHERGILYAPDYVINSAGAYLIAGRGELEYSDERLAEAAASIGQRLRQIFERAAAEDRPTSDVADAIAEERIAAGASARALAAGPAYGGDAREMKMVDALAAGLAAEGIRDVFCLVGDGNLELMVELAESHGVKLVHARHEQGAVAMADGFARRGGSIGVASVTHGPGLTQTATSLKVAVEHGSRILLIAGGTPTEDPRHIQHFDHAGFVESLGGAVVPIRSSRRWAADLGEALRSAAAGVPTVLVVPTDYQSTEVPAFDYEPVLPMARLTSVASSGLDEAVAALAAAERPVLLAGRGAIDAQPELAGLATRLAAPIVTTLGGMGVLSRDPRQLGMIGSLGDRSALQALERADLVLAVGASLNPWSTKNGRSIEAARVVQIDRAPAAIERFHAPDIALVGESASTLAALTVRLDRVDLPVRPTAALWAAAGPTAGAEPYEDGEDFVDPRRLVAALDAALPADRTVVFDGGHFITFACSSLRVQSPERYIFSCDFATVGQGLGMAIGAAVASGTPRTTLIVGDGGLMMSSVELDTAVRLRLPLDIVVFDDEAYGQEAHSLAAKGRPIHHATFAVPDLAAIARGYGLDGHEIRGVRRLEELPELLGGDAHAGPRLIDVKVNPAVVSPAAREIFRQVREVVPA